MDFSYDIKGVTISFLSKYRGIRTIQASGCKTVSALLDEKTKAINKLFQPDRLRKGRIPTFMQTMADRYKETDYVARKAIGVRTQLGSTREVNASGQREKAIILALSRKSIKCQLGVRMADFQEQIIISIRDVSR